MSGQVSVAGLCHAYGPLETLREVSFDAAPATVTALLGPTGCGKSTILRVLAGIVIPTAGTASIDHASAIGVPGRCAYMPQGDSLLPWRRARDNTLLSAQVAGTDIAAATRRADTLFARFGLAGFERSWPSELSGGMRQRVALLRTIMTEHPVLLLDEPFGALDAITRSDLHGWFGDLLRDEPRTTILVTHDIDEALRLADQIMVFTARPGRVAATIALSRPRPRSALHVLEPDCAMVKRQILEVLATPSGASL
jgi:ABC-type nitrate/sulfonate/bicarbonate transport system ATPase subunit